MEQFDLAALGNWLYSWVQPDGAIHGFHNHSVWGDNPIRWADYTSGHSTFAAPMLPALAILLEKGYDARGAELLERMMRHQAQDMRPDGEYNHIGFQTGELAKTGLIHNMVPALSLALAVCHGKEFLHPDTIEAARRSVHRALDEGGLHYGGGRAGKQACCNQDYARIWARLLVKPAFGEDCYEQIAREDLDFMVEHFHLPGVPDADCDGTLRALEGKDQYLLEPAEYYGLMIAPLCLAWRQYGEKRWLDAAVRLSRHVARSSFVDERGCRRVHRAYYSRTEGSWGRLTQPMQVQGNGLTLLAVRECAALAGDAELAAFVRELEDTMCRYQTRRGFLCAATGWNTEADAVPCTAWQSHDFLCAAQTAPAPDKAFWDRFFAPQTECSVVLASNCVWLEQGERWAIQDYFSRSAYQILGRKDRVRFGRDLAWTGEENAVDASYHWDSMPVFVLDGDVVAPLRPLDKQVKVYNFSPYRWEAAYKEDVQ